MVYLPLGNILHVLNTPETRHNHPCSDHQKYMNGHGHVLTYVAIFFFLLFEYFLKFGICDFGDHRRFTELRLMLHHLLGPELFIARKVKSLSENKA